VWDGKSGKGGQKDIRLSKSRKEGGERMYFTYIELDGGGGRIKGEGERIPEVQAAQTSEKEKKRPVCLFIKSSVKGEGGVVEKGGKNSHTRLYLN